MVQSAYCIAVNGGPDEFDDELLADIFDLYDQEVGEYNKEFYDAILSFFKDNYRQNDQKIKAYLLDNWSFERFDPVVLSVIRVAICEITSCAEFSAKMLIDEYVTLACHFVMPSQVSFINAILDKINRENQEG